MVRFSMLRLTQALFIWACMHEAHLFLLLLKKTHQPFIWTWWMQGLQECFLLQGKDILKFASPLWRGRRQSKAEEKHWKGNRKKNFLMRIAVKGGLVASVDSGGSFVPERHTQGWDILLSKMVTEVSFLLTAQPEREPGICPCSPRSDKVTVLGSALWILWFLSQMPTPKNLGQGTSTEKQGGFFAPVGKFCNLYKI